MKKIIIFNIGTNLGGIEKSLIQFLKYISTMELEIDLVLWKKPGELYSEIPSQINILSSPSPGRLSSVFYEKRPIKILKRMKQYIQVKMDKRIGCAWKHFECQKKQYDIAISYCQNGYSPYYVIDKVSANEKYLFYHHGSYEKGKKEQEVDLEYYKKYNKIITVSDANKSMLETHFPELKDKILVIHNLLDEEKIRFLSNEKLEICEINAGCKIVSVGRISEEKGQLFSLEVAKLLKQQKFQFHWIFVGDGPQKDICVQKVKEYDLEKECIFVGAQTNPYSYMRWADLYVQTSSVEADPVTIQEAMILCKPIIVSDILAMREATGEGQFAILCSLNKDSFVKAIVSLYGDMQIRETLLSNIQNRVNPNKCSKEQINNLLFKR